MKKEYKTPEAEVMVFDYEENVVASNYVYELGRNDDSCKRVNDQTDPSICHEIG